ncbi:MAG: UDP-N-acetylmuramoyl-L-alanyl-D-glutamate--2,6-diaminopimelate ligase [bacterium]
MRLEALLEFSGLKERARGWEPHREVRVSGVTHDSRQVRGGDLFAAVPGERADGHDFVSEAAERGAAAALVEHPVEVDIPQVVLPDVRAAMGAAAAAFWGHPAERLFTVGITGTNGKTTTAHLVRGLLAAEGGGVGMLGTVHHWIGGEAMDRVHTTPEATDIQRLLARMLEGGDGAAVLEVSSHALALHRLAGTLFDVGVFTNLGRDHLDFHGSMDAYLEAKRTLFTRHLKEGGGGVVNIDDPAGARLAAEMEMEWVTTGLDPAADVRAEEVETDAGGVRFDLCWGEEGRARVESPLLGLFNVANLLAAGAVGRVAGLDIEKTARTLSGIGGVPGRMQRLEGPGGVTVVLDYAHKPEALRGALQACRELTDGRLLVLFGCGGDRDRGKRPLMGRIAALGADRVIVTSDNPRTEDPAGIIREIVSGIPPEADAVAVTDRREAITRALAEARPGDLVLVAGKGHEQYQVVGSEKLPFDEAEVVAEAVAALGSGGAA